MFDSKEKEKRQSVATKVEAMKTILDVAERESRELTNEEIQKFDALDSEVGQLQKDLGITADGNRSDKQARVSTLEKELSQIVNPHAVRNFNVTDGNPHESWVNQRTGAPIRVLGREERMSDLIATPPEFEGFSIGKFIRGLATSEWSGAERERRAMNETTGGSGLYMVPSPLSAQIIDKARNASVMFKAGALLVPMDSKTLNMARWAGDPTAAWHTEAAAITASDATLEQVTFTAQTLVSLVQLSVEVLEDAAYAMVENALIFAIRNLLATTVGIAATNAITAALRQALQLCQLRLADEHYVRPPYRHRRCD